MVGAGRVVLVVEVVVEVLVVVGAVVADGVVVLVEGGGPSTSGGLRSPVASSDVKTDDPS